MKNLLLCFCLVLFSYAFAFGQDDSQPYKPLCPGVAKPNTGFKFPNVFRMTKNLFKKAFRIQRGSRDDFPPACINDIILSQTEVLAACSLPKTTTVYCPEGRQSVRISITADNPMSDVLTYNYKVSSGEIVGQGRDIVWNLANEKPGVYTIAACVDNGMGCLRTITKEVKVVECPDCR